MEDNNLTDVSEEKPVVKKKKIGLLIAISLLAIVLVTGLLFYCLHRTQIFEAVTYELGTELETDISYYVKGSPIALSSGVLDLNSVDNMTVGEYIATVSFNKKVFSYSITIKDTTPPVIELKEPDEVWFCTYGPSCLFPQVQRIVSKAHKQLKK